MNAILPPGWTFRRVARKTGVTKGSKDTFFYSPEGKRFRSFAAVQNYLGNLNDPQVPSTSIPVVNSAPNTANMSSYAKASFAGKNQYAETPQEVLEWVRAQFGCDFFDPCPKDPQWDGLSIEWQQHNYVNPPYRNIEPWLAKSFEEAKKGRHTILLLPARTSPLWFHKWCMRANRIWFVAGGIIFKGYKARCPFGCMLVEIHPTTTSMLPQCASVEFHRESRFRNGLLQDQFI